MIGRILRNIAGRAIWDAARRLRDRWKILRLEYLAGVRRWNPAGVFALVTNFMAAVSLMDAARRRKWGLHIAGLLLLFVSALYFHEDFARRDFQEF